MKAITVKFHGPANVRGSRYIASDSDGNKVILSADDTLNHDNNCTAAAIALCRKMQWDRGRFTILVSGALNKRGDTVYVFDAPHCRVTL